MAPSPTITPANPLLRRQNGNPNGSPAAQLDTTTIIGLSVAGGALLILGIWLTVVWIKKKWRKQEAAVEGRTEGQEIPSTSVGLRRPNHQRPSIGSSHSTLADIKSDPCVAASDIQPTNDADAPFL